MNGEQCKQCKRVVFKINDSGLCLRCMVNNSVTERYGEADWTESLRIAKELRQARKERFGLDE